MKVVNNYFLKKTCSEFIDGKVDGVEFCFCGNPHWEYFAEIRGDKVILFKKCADGSSKRVNISLFKEAALKYFNETKTEIVKDYIRNN